MDTYIPDGILPGNILDNQNSEREDIIPTDIADFMTINGISSREYEVTLNKFNPTLQEWEFLCTKKNYIIPTEQVGEQYGAGKYKWNFTYVNENVNGKKQKLTKVFEKTLGSHFDLKHEEYKSKIKETQELKDIERQVKTLQRTKLLEGSDDGMLKMKQTVSILKDLGINIGNQSASTDKTMEILMSMQQQSQAQMQQFLTMMVQMQQAQAQNQAQMIVGMMAPLTGIINSVLTNSQGKENPMGMFNQAFQMVSNIMDKKMEINAPQESTLDKILGVVSESVPLIMSWASQTAEARQKSLTYKMAMGTPEFKQVKNDSELLEKLINKVDEAHGTAVTDAMLKAAEINRPEHLKENYTKFPEQVDSNEE